MTTFHLRPRLRIVALVAVVVALPLMLVLRWHEPRRANDLQGAPGASDSLSEIECWFADALPVTCAWLLPSTQDSSAATALPVVILRRAASARSRIASIYLAGGPGGSSYLYEGAMTGWEQWRDGLGLDHDLVLYDARGTGFSLPSLECESYLNQIRVQLAASAETLQQQIQLRRDYEATIGECARRLPPTDRRANLHSTPVHVRDLLDLVRGLRDGYGYEGIVLYGVSYGSRLAVEAAAAAASDEAATIDRIVLDSYYPPGSDLTLRTAQTWGEVLDDHDGYCAATPACRTAPGAGAPLRRQVAQLIQAPTLSSAVREIDLGASAGATRRVAIRIDAFNLIEMLMHALSANLAPEELATRVMEARAGQWSPQWQALALSYVESSLDTGFSPVAFELAECADTGEATSAALADVLARNPEFSRVLTDVPEMHGYCDRLGVTPAPLAARRVDIDALVVSMQLDPVTPWRVARSALQYLPRAEWRRVQGAGHGVADSNECAARAIGAYMNSGDLSGWSQCNLVEARGPGRADATDEARVPDRTGSN